MKDCGMPNAWVCEFSKCETAVAEEISDNYVCMSQDNTTADTMDEEAPSERDKTGINSLDFRGICSVVDTDEPAGYCMANDLGMGQTGPFGFVHLF